METTDASAGPHFVGKKEDLIKAKHSFRTLAGRDILVMVYQGIFYAMDYHCYQKDNMESAEKGFHGSTPQSASNSAGALENGDIEELGGQLCIICPNHKYKISLIRGECLYTIPSHDGGAPKCASRGVKQRIHTVTETNGDIYVTLSQEQGYIESDKYQGPQGKLEREKVAEKEAANKAEREKKMKKK